MGQSTPIHEAAIAEDEYYLLLTCLKLASSRLSKTQVLELADMLFDELRTRRGDASEARAGFDGEART